VAMLDLDTVLSRPESVVPALEAMPCVDSVTILRASPAKVVLDLVLVPDHPTFVGEGYPVEEVRVVIRADGEIRAIPKGTAGRSWLHRNRFMGIWLDLCLWDPNDPEELRWSWEDGLEEYVRIVARHLVYEEFHRRHGEWPVEDAPHGVSPTGSWPLRTRRMMRAVRRWRRG